MTCWVRLLDKGRLLERLGTALPDRAIEAAARDLEAEVGHDALENESPERLEALFAAYLRKWLKRVKKQAPEIYA